MSETQWRRIVMREVGFDADLEVETRTDALTPKRSQVLVAVEACGVCHRDLIDRAGRFPFLQTPIVPGHEAVGHVMAVGPDVSEWAVGDRVATMHRDFCGACAACTQGQTSLCERAAHVFGLVADGGYAQRLLAPSRALYRADETMPAPMAATLHCTYGSAWRGLHAAGPLAGGEHVLVTGANGGVGLAAVELSRRLGAGRVTAVVRRDGFEALLTARGADAVVVDTDGTFHKQLAGSVDRALDCVGAPVFHACLKSLKVGGAVTAIGNVVPDRVPLNLGWVITRGVRILGAGGANRDDMAALIALWREGPFDASIEEVLPLAQADAAQRRLKAGGVLGRLVLSAG